MSRPWLRRYTITVVLLAVAASAHASRADAQGTAGTIAGTVLDPSGAVLPGAAVAVTSLRTSEVRTTLTDAAGTYSVANLPAGTYRVEVQVPGFERFTRSDARRFKPMPSRASMWSSSSETSPRRPPSRQNGGRRMFRRRQFP